MSNKLLQQLRQWRDREATRRGVEKYRVLQNKTLEEIATEKPETKEKLSDIYGIGEKKLQRYGRAILDMVSGAADESESGQSSSASSEASEGSEPISVSEYLNSINRTLADMSGRVAGEVVEFDLRDNYLFFTLKDPEAEAALRCFMWRRDYDLAGIDIEEGIEIAVSGYPEVYKPSGRFTFRATMMELVGEGALKKAYEKLKKKLTEEGLFAPERKKSVSPFPQKIGLITSKESDAYHDFLANIGSFGFSVSFHPSRVQGANAVKDLLAALEYFDGSGIDALVITRGGGGNLEVLQAFNNEAVVRRIVQMDIPVIVGVGHEKDEPLASMAADVAVSTPTACAEYLNRSYTQLEKRIDRYEQRIINECNEMLRNIESRIDRLARTLEHQMESAFLSFQSVVGALERAVSKIEQQLTYTKRRTADLQKRLFRAYIRDLRDTRQTIARAEDQLERVNPRRVLERGYGIVSGKDGVVRSIGDVSTGDEIDIRLADGTIESHVIEVEPIDTNE